METELLIITVGQKAFWYVMLALFFMASLQRLAANGEQTPRQSENTAEPLHFSEVFAQRRFIFDITPFSLVIHSQIPTMEDIKVEIRDAHNALLLKETWAANTNELQAAWKGFQNEEYHILLQDSCSNKVLKFNIKHQE